MLKKIRLNPSYYQALKLTKKEDYTFSEEILFIRNSLNSFGKYLLGFDVEGHHQEWFNSLVTESNSSSLLKIAGNNIRVCAPRNSAKTTWGAIFLAWVIGHNPNIRIILVSYSREIATAIGSTVKRIIETDEYRRIFPSVRKSEHNWSTLQWTIKREKIIKDPTLLSVGMNGGISSRRADLIYIDDPIKNSQSIANKVIRESMDNWYDEVLEPCLVKGGRVVVMATRYRADDIHATKFNKNNGFEVITQQAILVDKNGNEYSYWESQHPIESLKLKRSKNPSAFSSQYQNNPLVDGDVPIKKDWIKYTNQLFPTYSSINIGIDLAASLNNSADFNAYVVLGRIDTSYHVIESGRCRLSISKYSELLINLAIKYLEKVDSVKFYIESVAYQLAFSLYFKEQINERTLPIRVNKVTPKGDKLTRLLGVSHLIEKGKTVFYNGNNNEILINELTTFPLGANDDLVDAYVYAQRGFRKSILEFSSFNSNS